MTRLRRGTLPLALAVTLATVLPAAASVSTATSAAKATAACPWMDSHQQPSSRARQLVAAMTLDQKVAELYGTDGQTWFGAASHIAAVPGLCIPDLLFNDAGSGLADQQQQVTSFPVGLAQAATWNPATQRAIGAAIGREAHAKGIAVMLAPGVDIGRNPLAGRNFEYAGEDPVLAGETGAALVEGIQSQHVVAAVKHYALNDQEANRMTDSSDVDVRTMQEIHLPAFRTVVAKGRVGSVMCAYNRVNGMYACENDYLLNQVLKKQFAFAGWVMSDWGATHSTVDAANHGLDEEQNGSGATYFSSALKAAVQQGKVSLRRLDDMVYRLIVQLFRIGLFDHPPVSQPNGYLANVNTAQDRAVSLAAAEESSVLLKNEGSVLPLRGTGQRIAVIGDPASPVGASLFAQGQGSGRANGNRVVAPLTAIAQRARAAGDLVTFDDGLSTVDATVAAATADVAVVFIADGESEGFDATTLDANGAFCGQCGLPQSAASPNQLVAAVAAANPNTVVVVQSGRPISMPWLHSVKAVLDMWYPGEQDGNAAAALLYGDVNPSAKLPMTFPRQLADGPLRTLRQYPGVNDASGVPHSAYDEKLLVGYRWYDAKCIAPLFPFGFGLTYTSFSFSRLSISAENGEGPVTVSFTVRNTGQRAGADVAQLYVGMPASAGEPPRQLKAFKKVFLSPAESRRVTLRLDDTAFVHWDTPSAAWAISPGRYTIWVGDSSSVADLPLLGSLRRDAKSLPASAW